MPEVPTQPSASGGGHAAEGSAPAQQPAEQSALEQLRAQLQEREAAIQALQQTVEARTAERERIHQALLAAHRRALLAEHRGAVVEDLVQGDSVEALEASIARARGAHARIADQLRAQAAAAIPAGNPPRAQPSFEGLSPQAKIAAALRGR